MQYPLEKVIGRISPWIKSRRYPYVNFSKIIRVMTQLSLLPYIFPEFSFDRPKVIRNNLYYSIDNEQMELLHPTRNYSIKASDEKLLLGYYRGLLNDSTLNASKISVKHYKIKIEVD
jgi:hypothetical protein